MQEVHLLEINYDSVLSQKYIYSSLFRIWIDINGGNFNFFIRKYAQNSQIFRFLGSKTSRINSQFSPLLRGALHKLQTWEPQSGFS